MDEEGLQSNAEQSYEFLRQACEFKPGTLLYIGGVIDYHFNLKTLNDERYGTFQTDYQGILGRQGTDGRTFAVSYAKENKTWTIVSHSFSIKSRQAAVAE